ncbi:MAG: integrase core domain-containing protein [Burkholderiales bacterium]
MVILARLFERRAALFVVQPKTMIRWQRAVVAPVVAMEVSTVPTENAGRVTWTDLQDGAGEFDRDSIFSRHSDESIRALGLGVLKSPARCPKANAICERVIGTIRRECLDWLIPISEGHLRSILKSWVEHYNRGRPHSSLGPGVPDPPQALALNPKSQSRHRLAAGAFVLAKSVLGGLHHEYCLATPASA